MALTYGFYNSVKGDRKYDAMQFSELIDTLIIDGIIPNQGQLFAVTSAENGMQINVGTGLAWFFHSWTKNDSVMVLTVTESDITRPRIDAVVLEVDRTDPVRANAIKIVKGEPNVNAEKPTLVNTEKVHQYPLAYITVPAAAEEIRAENIENMVGRSPTVFATGVLETVPLDDLWAQWNGEWDTWFTAIKLQLSGDIVANLQLQIEQKVNVSDKATDAEATAGTNDTKWMTPKTVKKVVDSKTTTYVDGGQKVLSKYNVLVPIKQSQTVFDSGTEPLDSTNNNVVMTKNYILVLLNRAFYSQTKHSAKLIVYKKDLSQQKTHVLFPSEDTGGTDYKTFFIGARPNVNEDQVLISIKGTVSLIKITSSLTLQTLVTFSSMNVNTTSSLNNRSLFSGLIGTNYFSFSIIGSNSRYYGSYSNSQVKLFEDKNYTYNSIIGNSLIGINRTTNARLELKNFNLTNGSSTIYTVNGISNFSTALVGRFKYNPITEYACVAYGTEAMLINSPTTALYKQLAADIGSDTDSPRIACYDNRIYSKRGFQSFTRTAIGNTVYFNDITVGGISYAVANDYCLNLGEYRYLLVNKNGQFISDINLGRHVKYDIHYPSVIEPFITNSMQQEIYVIYSIPAGTYLNANLYSPIICKFSSSLNGIKTSYVFA